MNKPTWKNTFNGSLTRHGWIWVCHNVAQDCGYEYFIWNDRIYETKSANDTDLTIDDIEPSLTEEHVASVLKKFGGMQINISSKAAQNTILEAIFNG